MPVKKQHTKQEYISITGARANNLKNISLKIPRNKFVVITGVSGSGKSSLAFDTLYAEGQRRYAESLSSFARQFLGRMAKPDVDKIDGIPPAIAIQQKVSIKNPRSTVGTTTEIYDYLRILFAKIGRTYSPISGCEVKRHRVEDVLEDLESLPKGAKLYLLLPLEGGLVDTLLSLKQQGYSRLYYKGQVIKIEQVLQKSEDFERKELFVLLSRWINTKDTDVSEIRSYIESGFAEGNGKLYLACESEAAESSAADKSSAVQIREYSNRFEADGILFEEPNELMFSFNSPIGACPTCGGSGTTEGIDERLVIPNASLSVYEDAVAPWRGKLMSWYKEQFINEAYKFDFPIHRPYAALTQKQKDFLWNGKGSVIGINGFFEWVDKKKYKIQYKYMLSRYSGKAICRECGGSRLKREASYVKLCGKSIAELMSMCVTELIEFFKTLQLTDYERKVAERAMKEIVLRLECIDEVGLGYLTLNRKSATLSGGESQRINLVSSLGSNLVGSLYILDEPSVGLHSKDTQRLINVIKRLRDLGNTIVVVEHDAQIICSADYLIDIGPLAGSFGGEVVYEGEVSEPILKEYAKTKGSKNEKYKESLTLDYLSGLKSVDTRRRKREWSRSIILEGAMEHNLKEIDVQIPLNAFTVITGVSGSGKSSLVGDVLYPALCRHFQIMTKPPGAYKALKGDIKLLSGVEYIDQNPMGRSDRSNPVTYLKIYDDIRSLFSEQPYAKASGYTNSYFSFNKDLGRCPICLGEGYITVPMQFMADVKMLCTECGGKRFKQDILQVRYHGKDITDVLDMRVDEAIEFFASQKEHLAKKVVQGLGVLQRVGLGYVKLGQSTSTLSGGESQRLMLANFLSKEGMGAKSRLFIFDEPTTGLHFNDIKRLLDAMNALVDAGNTIVVVEHNTDVIRDADWCIELGPGSGADGGTIIYTGVPSF